MSKRGPQPGTPLSEQHKQRIAEGMRAAHARRAEAERRFGLQILAIIKPAVKETPQ